MKTIIEAEGNRYSFTWWQLFLLFFTIFSIGYATMYFTAQIGIEPHNTVLQDLSCTELADKAQLYFNLAHNTHPIPSDNWASISNMYFNAYLIGCVVGT